MCRTSIIIVVLSLSAFELFAQNWSGTTPGNIYYNGGNVGIGTSNPGARLHLFNTSSDGVLIQSDSWPQVDLISNANDFRSKITINNTNGDLQFRIGQGASGTDGSLDSKLLITQDGKVGVGTTDPREKLDIRGNVHLPKGQSIGFSPSGHSFFHNSNPVGHYSVGWFDDPSFFNGAPVGYLSSFGGIKFFTQGSSRVAIKTNGDVGIGTTTPSAKLEIKTFSDALKLYKASDADKNWLVWSQGNNRHAWRLGHQEYPYNLELFVGDGSNVPAANAPGNHVMTWATSGNVGIGTTSPDRKLTVNGDIKSHGLLVRDDGTTDLWMYTDGDVGDWSLLRSNKGKGIGLIGQVDVVALAVSRATSNVLIGKTSQSNTSYKLDVAGKVRANEIVVNTTGADYVFEEDYKLKTLGEVETYIQENGHLPDIPSAEEMRTNGMAVGELNTKLLEKIEELTLYLIEQNKKLDKQSDEIMKLQKENVQLHQMLGGK